MVMETASVSAGEKQYWQQCSDNTINQQKKLQQQQQRP